MDVELSQLRALVAIIDAGSFTDAAIDLGVSQAAVSRTLARLEQRLGVRLVRRTTREVALTAAGTRVLPHARQLLADIDALVRDARAGHDVIRVGYAWSSVGTHTVAFQRRWQQRRPDTELVLVRHNSPTAGLTDGTCDVAIVRNAVDRPVDAKRFDSVVVGLERRFCAFASDDNWARRRFLRLADLATRTVVMDRRTGTTTPQLWPPDAGPTDIIDTSDVDDWLGLIAAGGVVGMTSEATVAQYPRPGVSYREVRDAPAVPVLVVWWRDEVHPAAGAVAELLTQLYRDPGR